MTALLWTALRRSEARLADGGLGLLLEEEDGPIWVCQRHCVRGCRPSGGFAVDGDEEIAGGRREGRVKGGQRLSLSGVRLSSGY